MQNDDQNKNIESLSNDGTGDVTIEDLFKEFDKKQKVFKDNIAKHVLGTSFDMIQYIFSIGTLHFYSK